MRKGITAHRSHVFALLALPFMFRRSLAGERLVCDGSPLHTQSALQSHGARAHPSKHEKSKAIKVLHNKGEVQRKGKAFRGPFLEHCTVRHCTAFHSESVPHLSQAVEKDLIGRRKTDCKKITVQYDTVRHQSCGPRGFRKHTRPTDTLSLQPPSRSLFAGGARTSSLLKYSIHMYSMMQ